MTALMNLIDLILNFYTYIIIISVVFSWLFAFNVVNPRNPVMANIYRFCYQMTEPLLSRIRRVIPVVGGMDMSPIVLLFGIYFIRNLMRTGIY